MGARIVAPNQLLVTMLLANKPERLLGRLSWRDEMSHPLLTLIDVVHCDICDLSQSDNVRPRT